MAARGILVDLAAEQTEVVRSAWNVSLGSATPLFAEDRSFLKKLLMPSPNGVVGRF